MWNGEYPRVQDTSYTHFGGVGAEEFDPLIHLPPELYAKYSFKWAERVMIHINNNLEPHDFGHWGAPALNSYPFGEFIIVGYEDQDVYLGVAHPGPFYGRVFRVWSRWIRIVEFLFTPRPYVGPIVIPHPPNPFQNPPPDQIDLLEIVAIAPNPIPHFVLNTQSNQQSQYEIDDHVVPDL